MDTAHPLVCATVTGRSTAELRARRDAQTGADLVEVRIDTVGDPDAAGAIAGRALPVVVTCRRSDEGGWFRGSEQARRALLLAALDAGADYVDLEFGHGFDDEIRTRHGRHIVLSLHDFEGCPADLEARVDAMAALCPDVLKIAVTVSRVADCGRLAAIGRQHAGRPMVLIAMGEAGLVTRLLPGRFGSCWTYAGDGVAPGQIDTERLHAEFRFRRIGPHTALYGIAGQPVAHSLSPAMHNAAFQSLGLDAAYVPLAAADTADLFDAVRMLGLAGASVTAPFKVEVMTGLASCEEDARQTGAVNTLVRGAGGWRGHNTDLDGFLAGCAGFALNRQRVAVLGTGGAARAVALAARRAGAEVTCYGRDPAKAGALAAALGVGAAPRPVPAGAWDLLVNATPVGTHPDTDQSAFPESSYDGRVVYDLVYNPARTRFLREASARGCRTIGGLGMLVAQARRQVELWTGLRPDAGPMREAAEWSLSRQAERT
ncbi:MAG TPA: shikimate dehydrogenase [Vicinamibacterales bacterium]|nr:shikimate dehydrogenase [Vicinamibacterales bacterium]